MLDVICGDRCGDRARCALKGWKQCHHHSGIKNLLDSCGMLHVMHVGLAGGAGRCRSAERRD